MVTTTMERENTLIAKRLLKIGGWKLLAITLMVILIGLLVAGGLYVRSVADNELKRSVANDFAQTHPGAFQKILEVGRTKGYVVTWQDNQGHKIQSTLTDGWWTDRNIVQ